MFPIFQRDRRVDNQPLASSPSQATEATEQITEAQETAPTSQAALTSQEVVRVQSVIHHSKIYFFSFAEHGLVFLYM